MPVVIILTSARTARVDDVQHTHPVLRGHRELVAQNGMSKQGSGDEIAPRPAEDLELRLRLDASCLDGDLHSQSKLDERADVAPTRP